MVRRTGGNKVNGQVKIITAMLIFGSIGVFVKNINLTSSEIALLRGIIGSLVLIGASFLVKMRLSFTAIRSNLILLTLSGAAIGFNWIFLFEAYQYTSIANATVSYYFASVFVMALAPIVLKEKLTLVKVVSIITAMIGLFLIVGSGESSTNDSYQHAMGITYGLLAAGLYASVILMNKFIKNLSGFETTLVQLLMASFVLLPYVYAKEGLDFSGINSLGIILILFLGVVHTGFAYFLYFGAVKQLKGQTIAVLSYIDPISAVIIAAIFLVEGMNFIQILGGVLILGSTFLSENIGMNLFKRAKVY